MARRGGFGNRLREGARRALEFITPRKKIDPDEDRWVNLGTSRKRDLAAYTQELVNDHAFYQWLTDPLAGRIIEMISDFIVGDGFKITANSEAVYEVLEEWWKDEVNDFEVQQSNIATEFTIFGELVEIPYINEINGLVRLARLDPSAISKVVPHKRFPQLTGAVEFKRGALTDDNGEPIPSLEVIRRDLEPNSPTAGMLVGGCFYFAQNKIGSKTRGHSQMLRAVDWIDIYGSRLFNESERQELMKSFIWDITLKDADEAQIKAFLKNFKNPKPGEARVHSDAVEWDTVTPDLKSGDFAQANREFKTNILGAFGFPEHWFAQGGDVNYATAKAMNEPTLRMLKRLQKSVRVALSKMAAYQIEKAIEHGRFTQAEDLGFEILADEISNIDLQTMSAAITSVVVALQTAQSQGWINREEAADAFGKLFGQTGVEVEILEEPDTPEPMKDLAREIIKLKDRRRASGAK